MLVGPLQINVSQYVGITIDGIAFGFFLALLGVSITLVFGLGEVLNLAVGTFTVIGALAAVELASGGLHPVVAAVGGVLVVGALGVVVDRTLLSFVYKSEGEERILLGIFTTLGLTIMLDGILFTYYPSRYSLSVPLPSMSTGNVPITPSSVLFIVVALVALTVLFLFLTRTFLGRATRTVFQDEVGALLVGVEPRRIRSLVFVLSSLIAGLAGVLYVVWSPVQVSDGFQFATFGLIVSIVGGIRNVERAIVAGVFLGLVIQYANFFIGSYQAQIILFLTAVAAILIDPGELAT